MDAIRRVVASLNCFAKPNVGDAIVVIRHGHHGDAPYRPDSPGSRRSHTMSALLRSSSSAVRRDSTSPSSNATQTAISMPPKGGAATADKVSILVRRQQSSTSASPVQQVQDSDGDSAVSNPSRLVPIHNLANLSETEKEQIFDLYHQTYSRFSDGSLLLTKSDFIGRIGSYYDRIFVEKNSNGDISNAILCWERGNSNGCKVCLIFGGGSAEDKENRVSSLISLLKDVSKKVYIEANGPIAANILKDKEVRIAINLEAAPESLHYSSKKTPYGKKIIFGNSNSSRAVSPEMREFYAFLYDFNKLKLKLERSQGAKSQEIASALIDLFNLSVNAQIPPFFKAVLSNKISKKLSSIEGIAERQKSAQKAIEKSVRDLFVNLNNNMDEIFEDLTEGDKQTLTVLFGNKKDKILGESAAL